MSYQLKPGEVNYIDEVKRHYDRVGLTASEYTWECIPGRGRYTKIVANAKHGSSRCAVAFIDKVTGSMFKAASWSKPAKTRIC